MSFPMPATPATTTPTGAPESSTTVGGDAGSSGSGSRSGSGSGSASLQTSDADRADGGISSPDGSTHAGLLFFVLDGHGPHGDLVSREAMHSLHYELDQSLRHSPPDGNGGTGEGGGGGGGTKRATPSLPAPPTLLPVPQHKSSGGAEAAEAPRLSNNPLGKAKAVWETQLTAAFLATQRRLEAGRHGISEDSDVVTRPRSDSPSVLMAAGGAALAATAAASPAATRRPAIGAPGPATATAAAVPAAAAAAAAAPAAAASAPGAAAAKSDTKAQDPELHPAKRSGACAVVAHLDGKLLSVANAGDCRAVLGRMSASKAAGGTGSGAGSGGASDGKLEALTLTQDHKPDLPAEQLRIEAAGGWVRPAVGEVSDAGYMPSRLYADGTNTRAGPGLCMSRSLGDLDGMACGMTSKPEISQISLDPEIDRYLILASDGVWEFLTSESVIALVDREFRAGRSVDAVCKKIILEAALQWRLREGMYRDDISAIVIHLPPLLKRLADEEELAEKSASSRAPDAKPTAPFAAAAPPASSTSSPTPSASTPATASAPSGAAA